MRNQGRLGKRERKLPTFEYVAARDCLAALRRKLDVQELRTIRESIETNKRLTALEEENGRLLRTKVFRFIKWLAARKEQKAC